MKIKRIKKDACEQALYFVHEREMAACQWGVPVEKELPNLTDSDLSSASDAIINSLGSQYLRELWGCKNDADWSVGLVLFEKEYEKIYNEERGNVLKAHKD